MKSMNTLAAAAVLALTSAGMASAQTVYHVSGSTAFRAAVVSAEVAYCNANGTAYATYYAKSTANPAGNLNNSSVSVVQNGGATYSIRFENNFTGSIQGTESVVDGIAFGSVNSSGSNASFPNPQTGDADYPAATATAAVVSTNTPAAGGTYYQTDASGHSSTGAHAVTQAADIAFSDVSLSTADQIIGQTTHPTTTAPALNEQIGIVPFVFVANYSSDLTAARVTGLSMTPQTFTAVWNEPAFPEALSLFTGNSADQAVQVLPLGRDVDSGTRGTALAETGYPLNLGSGHITSRVYQYYPYNSSTQSSSTLITSSGVKIESFGLVPSSSIAGYSMPQGDGGYNSGGQLSFAISNVIDGTANPNTVDMTYLGVFDAGNALAFTGTNVQPPTLMAYNGTYFYPTSASATAAGVSTAQNLNAIYYGKYTYWSYENVFTNSTGSSVVGSFSAGVGGTAPPTNSLTNYLYTQQYDSLAANGISYNGMQVSRTSDGGNVQ
jgi:hypothetical protein